MKEVEPVVTSKVCVPDPCELKSSRFVPLFASVSVGANWKLSASTT